ncbi:MAG: T9SS type A sorting domain-containing protein [bacterium]|nr:T9SS type A sorting domain-containing protein [bacterium]
MRQCLSILAILMVVATVNSTVRNVPQQYPTIQAGINASSPGDTVLVAPGVYVENVQMLEGISLIGSGMDKTIVDGGGVYNVITSPYGVLNLVISDLSVRNSEQSGSAPGCIGIHLNPNSSSGTKIVRRCHVYNCGHGIQIWNDFGGTAFIDQNVIDNNLFDGFYPYLGTVYLRNNTIVDNGRDGYNDWSGGGNVIMMNNVFASNARYGILRHPSTPVSISYNDVWNNAQGNYMQGSPPQPFTPAPGTGEISTAPLFTGAPYSGHDRYYVTWANFPTPDSSKSPCIDAGNPAMQYYDLDGTRNDIGALGYDQRVHDVEITLAPVGIWTVPSGGGNLTYDISVQNHEAVSQTIQIWIMITLPNGNLYGPVVGPVQINVPPNASVTRQRTQSVPGSAPPGTYWYKALVGSYPTHPWDSSMASFIKQAGNDAPSIGDWSSTGESFDASGWEVQPVITSQPHGISLSGAYPNPFNPTTVISYELPAANFVNLSVYNIVGKKVTELVNGMREAGSHSVTFDGSGLAAGVYVYRLTAGEMTASGKMVLMK